MQNLRKMCKNLVFFVTFVTRLTNMNLNALVIPIYASLAYPRPRLAYNNMNLRATWFIKSASGLCSVGRHSAASVDWDPRAEWPLPSYVDIDNYYSNTVNMALASSKMPFKA